jgi:hypothetical protein
VAFKRREEPSIEEERLALRAQHAALEDLKRQLAERVDAVRERELELHHVLADANSRPGDPQPVLPPLRQTAQAVVEDEKDTGEDALAATRREEALVTRELAVAEREAQALVLEQALERQAQELEGGAAARPQQTEPAQAQAPAPSDTTRAAEDAERLARIEARLEELREAEKLFLRTRDELAARSEAVAARERLVAQKERELDERDDAGPWAPAELSEVEARLRRLEQQQTQLPGEQTAGFSGGLRKLQQGTTKPPRPV